MEVIEENSFTANYDILKDLQTKEMVRFVKEALSKLNEECRKKIRLYYYEGLKWKEIALILYPELGEDELNTKANTLRRNTSRKCLPGFKFYLQKLLG